MLPDKLLILLAPHFVQVEWNNPRDPTKGFKYLFLSDADYTSVAARADAAVLKAEPFFAENGRCRISGSCRQYSHCCKQIQDCCPFSGSSDSTPTAASRWGPLLLRKVGARSLSHQTALSLL